jgi:hypothetical protein
MHVRIDGRWRGRSPRSQEICCRILAFVFEMPWLLQGPAGHAQLWPCSGQQLISCSCDRLRDGACAVPMSVWLAHSGSSSTSCWLQGANALAPYSSRFVFFPCLCFTAWHRQSDQSLGRVTSTCGRSCAAPCRECCVAAFQQCQLAGAPWTPCPSRRSLTTCSRSHT